jgi:hypothetical protein
VSTVIHRLGLLFTTLFMMFALTEGASHTTLIVAATIAIAGVLAIRAAASVPGSRMITVGLRAKAHREELSTDPAPSHPSREGRPRTRAPSRSEPAA